MGKATDLLWIFITACVVLFWNGESGMDLHTAIVHYLAINF